MEKRARVSYLLLSQTSIDHIANDTFYKILFELTVKDIESLSNIDKRRNELINTERVWKALIRGDLCNFNDEPILKKINGFIYDVMVVNSLQVKGSKTVPRFKYLYKNASLSPWAPHTRYKEGDNNISYPNFFFPIFSVQMPVKEGFFQDIQKPEIEYDTKSVEVTSGHGKVTYTNTEKSGPAPVHFRLSYKKDIKELESLVWSYDTGVVPMHKLSKERVIKYNVVNRYPVTFSINMKHDKVYNFTFTFKGANKPFAKGEALVWPADLTRAKTTTVYSFTVQLLELDCKEIGYFKHYAFNAFLNPQQREYAYYNNMDDMDEVKRKRDELNKRLNQKRPVLKHEVKTKIGDTNVSVHSIGDMYAIYNEDKGELFCNDVLSHEKISTMGFASPIF